jgi:hypothetical protein
MTCEKQKGVYPMVVKFIVVVCFDTHDGALKLCVDESMKHNQRRQNIRFLPKWKSLGKMREIIQDNEVKLETRVANNG